MLFFAAAGLGFVATGVDASNGITLDPNNMSSIRSASTSLAFGLMSWYHNNQSDTSPTAIGTLPAPLYWWEAGAVWGGMVDNWAYTQDASYVPTITQALLAQVGPENNYMPPAYFASLGNDDQAFWALACLSAIEYRFPTPPGNASTVWLDLAEAVFNTMWPRWDISTCSGGLRWQIFPSNQGWDYKNTISNGGFFQISARLARYTGNQTYVDWAEKAWDWMAAVGLIGPDYAVYDGTDPRMNCSQVDHTTWSYNPAVLLYGAASMYNLTNGSDLWASRTTGLLTSIGKTFFSPFPNASNIMYERSCEEQGPCNYDQLSFKAYLARWMSKSAILMPEIAQFVTTVLAASAMAAVRSCSGGANNQTCGQKWYLGGYDGNYGVGQELSAMETVQSLLLLQNASALAPRHYSNVSIDEKPATSTFSLTPTSSLINGQTGTRASLPATSSASTVRSSFGPADTTSKTSAGSQRSWPKAGAASTWLESNVRVEYLMVVASVMATGFGTWAMMR